MLSTSALRTAYAPACSSKGNIYLPAYGALDACLKAHGYRPRSGVTGAYNCRKITGGTGYSLHAYGAGTSFTFWTGVKIATSLAVDINWDKNPYGPRLVTDMPRAMIDAVYRIRTNSGKQVWRWGGYYVNNKDAMHFEIVCSKADLATGINQRTLPGAPAPKPTPAPVPVPAPIEDDDDMFFLVQFKGSTAVYAVADDFQSKWWIRNSQWQLRGLKLQLKARGKADKVCVVDLDDPDTNMRAIARSLAAVPIIGLAALPAHASEAKLT